MLYRCGTAVHCCRMFACNESGKRKSELKWCWKLRLLINIEDEKWASLVGESLFIAWRCFEQVDEESRGFVAKTWAALSNRELSQHYTIFRSTPKLFSLSSKGKRQSFHFSLSFPPSARKKIIRLTIREKNFPFPPKSFRFLPLMTLTKTLADFAIVGTPEKRVDGENKYHDSEWGH